MVKLLVFDMDGTILDTIEDITNAVNYILAKNNFPLRSLSEVKAFVGNGLHRTLELSVPKGTSMDIVDGIFDEFVAYYKSHSNICTKPYAGIVDAISRLKADGYKLAVVSNKRQEAVEELCNVFYDGLFDIAMGDREGFKRKPDPDMVNNVLNNLCISREEAVYIGDSDVDIMTARNSKLKCISVSWGFRTREYLEEQGAELIIDSVDELVDVIRKI